MIGANIMVGQVKTNKELRYSECNCLSNGSMEFGHSESGKIADITYPNYQTK